MAGIIQKSERLYNFDIKSGQINYLNVSRDTKPNIIQILNRSNSTIYLSDNPNVSSTFFDKEILPYAKSVTSYVNGVQSLYFYSSANSSIDIKTYEADEVYIDDLDRTSDIIINTPSLPSNVTIANGADIALGSTTDLKITNSGSTGSIMGFIKGIVDLFLTLISKLPVSLSNSGNLKTSIEELPELNINSIPAIPAGNNNIGNVGINSLPSIPAGNNLIGNVGINSLPAIPAGNNLIGSVNLQSLPTDLEIKLVNVGNANTEYYYNFPAGTKKLVLNVRDGDPAENFRISYESGKVASALNPSLKFSQATEYYTDLVNFELQGIIYFATSNANQIIQIERYY